MWAEAADVTVVIPSFNASATLPRALASVAAQSVQPKEVICVDDASTDDSVALLRQFSIRAPFPVRVEALACNGGAARARNHGIRLAESRWIAFLDSDDAWHPGKLSAQLALAASTYSDLIGGYSDIDVPGAGAWPELDRLTCVPISLHAALWSNPFHTSTVLARASPQLVFPEDRQAEDFALWLLLLRDGARAVRHQSGLARMYKQPYGASGLSARLWAMERGELSALAEGCRGRPWLLAPATVMSLGKFAARVALHALR
jgi:glycosyltransferase involved in cell wall biosynthesis